MKCLGCASLRNILIVALDTKHIKVSKNGVIVIKYIFKPGQAEVNSKYLIEKRNHVINAVKVITALNFKATVEVEPLDNYMLYVHGISVAPTVAARNKMKEKLKYFSKPMNSRRFIRQWYQSIVISLTPTSPESFKLLMDRWKSVHRSEE